VRLPEKCFEWQVKGWKLGITLCPGVLMLGVWWDGNPISFAISFPFVHLWFERDGGTYWRWDWTILRIVIGKQEFRTDLALNDWGLVFRCITRMIGRSTSARSTSSASMTSSTTMTSI
jgi:hypothetical protein